MLIQIGMNGRLIVESAGSDALSQQTSVYLSYPREAEQDVAPIKSGLINAGFGVYPTSAPPGSAWAKWYRDQLDKADVVVAILTEGYFSGSFVYAELAEALDSGKRIIPVIPHKSSGIPAVLRGYQYVYLDNLAGRDENLQPLIKALRSQISAPVDAVDELGKIAAQERLVRLETEAQVRTIEQIRRQDDRSLVAASKATAGIFGGVAVGAVIGGPVGSIIGGIIAAALLGKSKSRHKDDDGLSAPSGPGASDG